MTNTEKRIKFWKKFAQLTSIADYLKIDFLVTCFYRTATEQKKLFDASKSKCDGYDILSNHQKYLAIDLVVIENGAAVWENIPKYTQLGEEWESLGGTWGGKWSSLGDIYHFEFKED